MHNRVIVTLEKARGGRRVTEQFNLRTQTGVNWMAAHMGSAAIAAIKNIAITQDTTTPASTMTNLVGELAADGLSRTTATFSHTANQSLYTQTASFNYTGGSVVTVARAAMVFAAEDLDTSADTHFCITALSPVAVMDSGDTLTIAWGLSI